MSEFKSNSEYLLKAKVEMISDANVSASLLKVAMICNEPFFTTDSVCYEDSGLGIYDGGYGPALQGLSIPELPENDFSDLDIVKSNILEIKTNICELNEKIRALLVEIANKYDDDLLDEELLKMVEEEAARDFINMGMAGGVLDNVELYKLVKDHLDDPAYLESLTDEQREYLNAVIEAAEAEIDYYNMNGYERALTDGKVFFASVTAGAGKIVEYVFDGSVMLASASLLYLNPFSPFVPAETKDAIINGTMDFVDIDIAGNAYDLYIDAAGINKYAAYGDWHKYGYITGEAGGEFALTLIPGGALVTAAVTALEVVGQTAEETKGSGLTAKTRMFYSLTKGAVEFGTSMLPEGITQEALTPVINSVMGVVDDAVSNGVKPEDMTPEYIASTLGPAALAECKGAADDKVIGIVFGDDGSDLASAGIDLFEEYIGCLMEDRETNTNILGGANVDNIMAQIPEQ